MERLLHISILLFAIVIAISLKAEGGDNPCDQYGRDLTTSSYKGILQYDLSRNGTITPPYVDSVWVTGRSDTSIVLMVSYAQSGESIDISFLPRGYYSLHVQIGDCIAIRTFTSRGTLTNNESPLPTNIKQKVIINGLILIRKNDIYYNIFGMPCVSIAQ